MLQVFLYPGNAACDASGVARDSEHGQILRMFINTLIWGAAAVAAALMIML